MRRTYKLREIAPPLPAADEPPGTQVWLLNLDQIEPHTGALLSRDLVGRGAVGSSTHAFDEGNVLYSKLRPYLNKVYLPDGMGFCTSELVPMRPNLDLVTREYLAAYLRSPSFLNWVRLQVDGAKMPRVSMKTLWDHEIYLPALDEQAHIADILDKADRLRRKRHAATRLAEVFLQSAFFNAFGDSETNPKGWPIVRLEEVAVQITDGEHQTPERSSEGVHLLSARNIQNGFLDFEDVDFVPLAEFDRIRRRCEPTRGDVLISCSGSIGRVAQVNVDPPTRIGPKCRTCSPGHATVTERFS